MLIQVDAVYVIHRFEQNKILIEKMTIDMECLWVWVGVYLVMPCFGLEAPGKLQDTSPTKQPGEGE